MSDILCRWLNQELRLSKTIEPKTIARDFSNGYLVGEVLHKYQLQNDFSLFMRKNNSISKLNNFTRLEPTLHLLGISISVNTVQDLMQEKQGAAARLLYQLYVSLEKRRRADVTGTMMEIMQSPANAGLHKKTRDLYADRLHQVVKRDAELKLQKISQHYEEKFQQVNNSAVPTPPIQPTRPVRVQRETRAKNIEKLCYQKYKSIMSNEATAVHKPKPPPYTSQLYLMNRRHHLRRDQQAQSVQNEIAQFEKNRKKLVTSESVPASSQGFEGHGGDGKLILQSSSKYIQEIRARMKENAVAHEEREKRRNRFLVEQLKSHEAQEEAEREEQLIKRLTRQTQQEQRLVSQLLQIRKQREVIQQNLVLRQQQYQQQRERDFKKALEREAALIQQEKLERAEEIKQELEFIKRLTAERAQSRYKKHFEICKYISEQIVDLATKIGEYRLITANLIPAKLMREWKELLLNGLPLYEPVSEPSSVTVDHTELQRQEILNNQDYDEYTNMEGEWTWPEDAREPSPRPASNYILGHVVKRLRNIVQPPTRKTTPSQVVRPTLKACVLGKFCSGKTTCLAQIAEATGVCVLSADTLLEEALNAFQNGEKSQVTKVTQRKKRKKYSRQSTTSASLKSQERDTVEETGDSQLSTRAMLGAAAEKELREGNALSNDLLVDIIVEAIGQVPAQSGWILDGFPKDITQAYLLEKALGGSVDDSGDESNGGNLAFDPDPPKSLAPSPPVLDLALLLDVPDEIVLTRALGHNDMDAAAHSVSQSTHKNLYAAQIPHRTTAFQETWPNLEEWFREKQSILVRVDANVDEDELFRRVQLVLQQVLLRKKEVPSPVTVTPVKPPKASAKATPPPVGTSRKTSVSSDIPPEPSSPCQAPSSGVYLDEPLPSDVPHKLYVQWEAMCDSYANSIKAVMQQMRSQSTFITHDLFNTREDFKHYLGRSDMRQVVVSQWQENFNSTSDDMRDDEETKTELHLRLDDLRERLWDISDQRKEQDEQEMASLMYGGWLENQAAVLIDQHSALTRVEVVRFRATLDILRVYYSSMYNSMLPEPPADCAPFPLLVISEMKDSGESTDRSDTSTSSMQDDRGGGKKIKFVSSPRGPKMQGQNLSEPFKLYRGKLISVYEEALGTIRKLVSAETVQGETVEDDSSQEKAIANKAKKKKETGKKPKGAGTPSPAPSPGPPEKKSEKVGDQKLRLKICKEYETALSHEESAAKARISLVKSHGLGILEKLQTKTEQVVGDMKTWLEAHYIAEMNGIDQLTEVIRHHIEAGTKLRNKLVLECNDFCLNGDGLMVASQSESSPPPTPQEKPTHSSQTTVQLESLSEEMYDIAPSGLVPQSEFSTLLCVGASVDLCRDTVPRSWTNMNDEQLMEIVSLLTDYELVNWRQFLLSAALPWPSPSLTQLLAVLQRFKAADTGNTGHVTKEQFLQTELWFPSESVQLVPDDPADPLPYDCLDTLRKFFFQLFADRSLSPPQLDYVSMLHYFAVDPNPRESYDVVLGEHLKHSSSRLVKSMPSIERDTELGLSDPHEDGKETECASNKQEGSLPALEADNGHMSTQMEDSEQLPPGPMSEEEQSQDLVPICDEVGNATDNDVPASTLSEQHFIQSLMESSRYQLINIRELLQVCESDEEYTSSSEV